MKRTVAGDEYRHDETVDLCEEYEKGLANEDGKVYARQ